MQDLITAENATVKELQVHIDSAFVEYTIDDDGDIKVQDAVTVFVRPEAEGRYIQLSTIFGFEPASTVAQRLECANKINSECIIIRASVSEDCLVFEHEYILFDGGLTPKQFIQGIRRFAQIPRLAVREHGGGIVE